MIKRRAKLPLALCLTLVAAAIIYLGYYSRQLPFDRNRHSSVRMADAMQQKENTLAVHSSPSQTPHLRDGDPAKIIASLPFIQVIINPEDRTLPRLECPAPSGSRYEHFRGSNNNSTNSDSKPKYFFALDLYECVNLLPRLLGSIVETIKFLGPENCALSIVEGRSQDGTFEVLKLMRPFIESLNVSYYFDTNDTNPLDGPRIDKLASLRNQALAPLTDFPESFSPEPVVVFLNDVSICMEDILELLLQQTYLEADMVCAMDWKYLDDQPTFYDVWVTRGMTGDTFFKIPEDGSWDESKNLLWNDPNGQSKFLAHKPFQVFSCWNGATVFRGEPLIDDNLRFRSSPKDTCFQGEPQIFAADLWNLGYGKIAVVPSVSLEYNDEGAVRLKKDKGYTHQWANPDGDSGPESKIDWQLEPPPMVKCIPNGFDREKPWVPWNESIVK